MNGNELKQNSGRKASTAPKLSALTRANVIATIIDTLIIINPKRESPGWVSFLIGTDFLLSKMSTVCGFCFGYRVFFH